MNLVLALGLVLLLLDGLQVHLFLASKVLLGHTELEEGAEVLREVAEEQVLILCIPLGNGFKCLVLRESHILQVPTQVSLYPRMKNQSATDSHQHHETLGLGVFVLGRAIPLAHVPFFIEKELVVVIRERGGARSFKSAISGADQQKDVPKTPWAVKATAICVASAKSVCAGKGDNAFVLRWVAASADPGVRARQHVVSN